MHMHLQTVLNSIQENKKADKHVIYNTTSPPHVQNARVALPCYISHSNTVAQIPHHWQKSLDSLVAVHHRGSCLPPEIWCRN